VTACWATQSFTFGDSLFVTQGELHDTADAVVVTAPQLFQGTPLTVGTQISPLLQGWLADNPDGSGGP
jgi:hypothetical protein